MVCELLWNVTVTPPSDVESGMELASWSWVERAVPKIEINDPGAIAPF
jgi:hypothetical protein